MQGVMEETATKQAIVTLGREVTVEVYLGRVCWNKQNGSKYFIYEEFRPYGRTSNTATYLITDGPTVLGERKGGAYHPGSFVGRALMGAKVGAELEVNAGGPELGEMRVGNLSGNHLKLVVLDIN